MDSLPAFINVLEHTQVSPTPATIGRKSLPLTFSDIRWLTIPHFIVHTLFFYDLPITNTEFTQTLVPDLKQSLSITLQHFFPFAGKLIIFPTTTRLPEICYVDGDSVAFTVAECNLDFNDLTGNHPRNCGKFYQLVPLLGSVEVSDDSVKIPVFSIQVTLFPDSGISIGMTYHHILGDASTTLRFRKAWASIAGQSGSDMLFLANTTLLPIYDRLFKYPQLDESYLKKARVETINEGFQLPRLSGPTNKVRATFILTRTVINRLKKLVLTQLPTLAYVSSLTVACAYIWNCFSNLDNNKVVLFAILVDCRSRMDPQIPSAYFGNCLMPCLNFARTSTLKEKEGFLTAAKLIGENLHKMLNDKNGVMEDLGPIENRFRYELPRRTMGVAGSPKINFYDFDLGFGKPRKYETISIDYTGSISISACRESNEDMEIGVCLSTNEMDVFIDNFNTGLESYI